MKKRRILMMVAVMAAAGGLWKWEHTRAAALEDERTGLLQSAEEVDRLRVENSSLASLRDAAEQLAAPEFSRTELMRLRNEVARGLAASGDPEALRRENRRLEQELSRILAEPAFEEGEGYVPRAAWRDAGLFTPENTVQTFFAALSQGNTERALQCLVADRAKQLERAIRDNPEGRHVLVDSVSSATEAPGYRVISHHTADDGRSVLRLQAAAGGAVLEMVLREEGEEWKIEQPFRPVSP